MIATHRASLHTRRNVEGVSCGARTSLGCSIQGEIVGQVKVSSSPPSPQAAPQGIAKILNQFCQAEQGESTGQQDGMGGVKGRRGLGHTFRHVCARMAQRRRRGRAHPLARIRLPMTCLPPWTKNRILGGGRKSMGANLTACIWRTEGLRCKQAVYTIRLMGM